MKKKRIAARMASAVVGVSLCFGASAGARAPVSYCVPARAGGSKSTSHARPAITTTISLISSTTTTMEPTVTLSLISGGGQPQFLNTKESAAQLDAIQ